MISRSGWRSTARSVRLGLGPAGSDGRPGGSWRTLVRRPSSAAARHLLPGGEGAKGKRDKAKGKSETARRLHTGEKVTGGRESDGAVCPLPRPSSAAARHLLPGGEG